MFSFNSKASWWMKSCLLHLATLGHDIGLLRAKANGFDQFPDDLRKVIESANEEEVVQIPVQQDPFQFLGISSRNSHCDHTDSWTGGRLAFVSQSMGQGVNYIY